MDFNPSAAGLPTLNGPATAMDYGNQLAQQQSQQALQNAQTANQQNDLQAKQRSMQLSMLSGVLNEQDPEKQRRLLQNIVPIANKINPSYQISPDIDIPTARALVQSQIPAADIPNYQMGMAKAGFYNRLLGGQQGQPQGQPGQPQGASAGGLSPADQTGLAIVDPAGSQALTATQKLQYESPEGQKSIAEAKKQGETIAEANKGVAGIDSRLQNAISILDDQIDLAPKTFSGAVGQAKLAMERNLPNIGIHPQGPTDQQKFEQNNANLFTQELPAILSSIPGARLDIPLVNAIKKASGIDEFGTPEEKIAAAQNLKGLLVKYQQNTHDYAKNVGGGNTPIQPMQDVNPPGAPQGGTQPQAPQTPKLVAGSTIYKGHLYVGGDPSKPTSWQNPNRGASANW